MGTDNGQQEKATLVWAVAVLNEPTWWLFVPSKPLEKQQSDWKRARGYWLYPAPKASESGEGATDANSARAFDRDSVPNTVERLAVFCVDVEVVPIGKRRLHLDAEEASRLDGMFARLQEREAAEAAEAAQRAAPPTPTSCATEEECAAPRPPPDAAPLQPSSPHAECRASRGGKRQWYFTDSAKGMVRLPLHPLGGPRGSWMYAAMPEREADTAALEPDSLPAGRIVANVGSVAHTAFSSGEQRFIIVDVGVAGGSSAPRGPMDTKVSRRKKRQARGRSSSSSSSSSSSGASSGGGSDASLMSDSEGSSSGSDDGSDSSTHVRRKRRATHRSAPRVASSAKVTRAGRKGLEVPQDAVRAVVRVGVDDFRCEPDAETLRAAATAELRSVEGALESMPREAEHVAAVLPSGAIVTITAADAASWAMHTEGREVRARKAPRRDAPPPPKDERETPRAEGDAAATADDDLMADLLGCIEEAATERQRLLL